MIPTRRRSLSRIVAAGLLLWPVVSLADARLEARRHFRNGMSLIAKGDFDKGIEELLEAYEIKPHPNVLYNIGRAYLDAGRVDEAVEYYRRYLAANPPDADQIRPTLVRLEESIAKRQAVRDEVLSATPKPPAGGTAAANGTVTAAGGTATGTTVVASAVDPQSLEKLNALMARLETAVARAEAVSTTPAQPEEKSGPRGSGNLQSDEATEGVPYEETVFTASRRAQTTLEAPNATTIITGEEIRLSGATSIVDVLRRVPGAEVMAMGVGSANVSMRGFNQRLSNKVLVLLDGRTEYQDFLGLTVWSAIPVGLEEIERIEVIRGPGSALYGANAMLGVINIITKAPGTGAPAEFNLSGGTGDSAVASFVHSAQQGKLRYRASVAFNQADKWSRDFADDRADVMPAVQETDLGLRSARANLLTHYAFNDTYSLSVSGGVNRLYTEIYPLGLLRNFFFDGLTAYAKSDVRAGPLHLKLFWNHLSATAGPQYLPRGEISLSSKPESNVFNGELLWQQSFQLLGEHRLNVGTEARLKRVSWSFLGQLTQEPHFAGFVQDEWQIVQPFRLVASYRIDRHPLLDAGKPGLAQSPRVSAVWIPMDGHALRAGFATAFREPTFLESYTQIRVPVAGVAGASAVTEGNLALRPEQMTAYELGYRGEFAEVGLEWDLALYQNHVKDLIALSPLETLPIDSAFDPQTNTYLRGRSQFRNEPGIYIARGVELGARFAPVDGLSFFGSGAFQNIEAAQLPSGYACVPCTQAPAFKAYLGAAYRSKAGFDFSVDGAYTSATTWVEREPSPADPTTIAFIGKSLPEYVVVNARVAYRFLDDRASIALVGTNLAPALTGPGNEHQEHPFGNFIGRRFFATLTVTP